MLSSDVVMHVVYFYLKFRGQHKTFSSDLETAIDDFAIPSQSAANSGHVDRAAADSCVLCHCLPQI